MIGAGVAWLLVETLGRRSQMLQRAAQSLAETASAARRRASNVAESVTEGVSSAAEYAQEGLSSVGQAVGERAKRGYEYGQEAVTQSWENYPLAMGVATLAAGLTAGLLLPRGNRRG
jgi:hypothetical protein